MDSYGVMKRKNTFYFYVVIAVIVGGYFFFLTSNQWMPTNAAANLFSPLNETMQWNSRDITIERWEYSPEQEIMEVELALVNQSYDGMDSYYFSAVDRKNDKLNVSKVVEDPDWIILQITGVSKNFGEVSLRLNMEESSDPLDALKMYTNVHDVARVDSISAKEKKEYQADRLRREISIYDKTIEKATKTISELTAQNKNMQKEIDRLNQDFSFQTDDQKEDTTERISEIQSNQRSNQEEIEDQQKMIEEDQKRIELLQKQIEEVIGK